MIAKGRSGHKQDERDMTLNSALLVTIHQEAEMPRR